MKCNWSAFADFLYPREGTETVSLLDVVLVLIGFSLSPRGDGNDYPRGLIVIVPDFLYPREGTETARIINTDY